MNHYKREVDALHASDSLRKAISELPQNAAPQTRVRQKHFAAWAAAIAAVLVVAVIGIPSVFTAMHKSAAMDTADAKAQEEYAAANAYGTPEEFNYTASTAETNAAVNTALPASRKYIRDAELSVETKTYDAFLSSVERKLSAMDGFTQSTDSGTNYSGSRYTTLVLRVPAEQLDAFLQHIEEVGTVTSQSTSVKDVTDDYIDLDSRVKALETEQNTLLSLLEKADSLSDTLEIQDRLSEVRTALESYKGKRKALEGQIEYSTVTMYVEEVERVASPEGQTFFAQVRTNLTDNLYRIGQGLRNFGIGFLSALPFIVLWLLLAGILVLIVVFFVRRRRKKRDSSRFSAR